MRTTRTRTCVVRPYMLGCLRVCLHLCACVCVCFSTPDDVLPRTKIELSRDENRALLLVVVSGCCASWNPNDIKIIVWFPTRTHTHTHSHTRGPRVRRAHHKTGPRIKDRVKEPPTICRSSRRRAASQSVLELSRFTCVCRSARVYFFSFVVVCCSKVSGRVYKSVVACKSVPGDVKGQNYPQC